MNILLTGSSGFIGSEIFSILSQERSINIFCLDKTPNSKLADSQIFIHHDLTSPLDREIKFDICVHLASDVGGILYNSRKGSAAHDVNALIDQSVLKLMLNNPDAHLIFISSINVFEHMRKFCEGSISTKGRVLSSYARSKILSENYFIKNLPSVAVVRPTNVYGASQIKTHSVAGESHVIPDLLHKIGQCTGCLDILGDGTQRRNFLHVKDLSKFILYLIRDFKPGFYNLR